MTILKSGGFLLFSAMLANAQVLVNQFEAETVGDGTYTGGWTFIHSDPAAGGTVSLLNVREGISTGVTTDSPASGKYLSYSPATGVWASIVTADSPYLEEAGPMKTITTEAWDSPAGHLRQRLSLDAGQAYQVSVWRYIKLTGNGYSSIPAFSVWDGSTVNAVTPFTSTPGSLLTYQPYDTAAGDWQLVTLDFTAPGTLGGGTVPVDFMMGLYSPTEVPAKWQNETIYGPTSEWDNNPRTVDAYPDGWTAVAYNGYYEDFTLGLDGFTVTAVSPIPEPGAAGLTALAVVGLGSRRRRSRADRA